MIAVFDPIHGLETPEEQWHRVGSQQFIIAKPRSDVAVIDLVQKAAIVTDDLSRFIVNIFQEREIPRNFPNQVHFEVLHVDYYNSSVPTTVRATYAQSHESFGFAKGKQCAAMVFVVLAYAQQPGVEWTEEELDGLLIAGNRLYLYARENSETPHERHLRADERKFSVIKYGGIVFVAVNINDVDLIGPCITAGHFLERTQRLLDQNCSISFRYAESFYGIFIQTQIINGEEIVKFCLYDSHGSFSAKLPEGEHYSRRNLGAVILMFDNLFDLVSHVFRTLLFYDSETNADSFIMNRLPNTFYLYAYSIDIKSGTGEPDIEPVDLDEDRPNQLKLSPRQRLNFRWGKMFS